MRNKRMHACGTCTHLVPGTSQNDEGLPQICFHVDVYNIATWSSQLARLEPCIIKLGLHNCNTLSDIPALLDRMPHLKYLEVGSLWWCYGHGL